MWVELAKIPFLCKIVPRQQKAAKAVQIIRETVERLVAQCKEIVEAEKETLQGEEYVNESDPSVLRFLLASREEVLGLLLLFSSTEDFFRLIDIIFHPILLSKFHVVESFHKSQSVTNS